MRTGPQKVSWSDSNRHDVPSQMEIREVHRTAFGVALPKKFKKKKKKKKGREDKWKRLKYGQDLRANYQCAGNAGDGKIY